MGRFDLVKGGSGCIAIQRRISRRSPSVPKGHGGVTTYGQRVPHKLLNHRRL